MWIKVENPLMTPGAMLIRRHHPNDFYIDITATFDQLSIQIKSEIVAGFCPGISTPVWTPIALSVMSDSSSSYVQLYCNLNLIISQSVPDVVENASGSYRIGQGFQGLIKDLTVYSTALGAQTFLKQTHIPEPCSPGFYYIESTDTCEECSPLCVTCTGPSASDCSACASLEVTKPDGTCGCEAGFYFHEASITCSPCDSVCVTCQNTPTHCTSCLSSLTLTSNVCYYPSTLPYNGVSCDCFQLTPDGTCHKCGNLSIDDGQECDDGNQKDNDGCSSQCTLQPFFMCPTINGSSYCFSEHLLSVVSSKSECQEGELEIALILSSPVFLQDLLLSHFKSKASEVQFLDLRVPSNPTAYFSVIIKPFKSPGQMQTQIVVQLSFQKAQFKTDHITPLDRTTTLPPLISFEFTPRQCPSSFLIRMAQIIKHCISSLSLAALFGGIPAQIFLEISLEPLWALLNTDQLIFFIPLISVPLSHNAYIIFKILSFAHGDLYLLVLFFQLTLRRLFPESASPPYTGQYPLLGYQTSGLFDNLGTFYTLNLTFIFVLLLFQFTRCSRKPNVQKLAQLLLWGSFLRLLLECFLEVILFTSISIVSSSSRLELYLASSTLILFIVGCFFILRVSSSHPSDLAPTASYSLKYKEIYQRLNVQGGILARSYYSWFLFRRFSVVALLLFFSFLPLLQLSLHILLNICDLLFLILLRPFRACFDQFFALINSFFLLSLYLFVGALYLFRSDQAIIQKYSWCFVIVILGFNALCFTIIIITKLYEIQKKCKKRKAEKRRNMKYAVTRGPVSESISACFEERSLSRCKSKFSLSHEISLKSNRRASSIKGKLESIE